MATAPFFVLSPSSILALIGLIKGEKPVQSADPALLARLRVDVVIPAYNEGATIALSLASVARQTLKPRSIIVFDDCSKDDTAEVVDAFAIASGQPVRVVRRRKPMGKTPSLRQTAYESDADVIFVLDADTILGTDDYLEKVCAQLYRVPGIASACGIIHPLRTSDRRHMAESDTIQRLLAARPQTRVIPARGFLRGVAKAITDFYRDALYHYMQNFMYVGMQNLFGTTMNPVGCAVAYRRDYLIELFESYAASLGDDLTSSEDIFFGFVFVEEGYHNTQVRDVFARTEEPEAQRVPRQLLLWSSAWLQSAYYFPELMMSPFRALKRFRRERQNADLRERRKVVDSYREPFGRQFSRQFGRPGGWLTFLAIFEKLSFPVVLIFLMAIGAWEPLAVTVLAEMVLYMVIIGVFSREHRVRHILRGLIATPLRYGTLLFDVVTIMHFLFDVMTGRTRWRK